MAYAISPNYQDVDFPSGMSLDQEIEVFADRVKGWQLDVAQKCADKIPHAGFAVLEIVFSYFEMIAKYKNGYTKDRKSEEYFRRGFGDVFPKLSSISNEMREKLLKKLCRDVRCGLYHTGITGPDVELSGDFKYSVWFASPPDRLQINPHRLVPDIKQHFQSYLSQLRDHKNEELRRNFETRFSYYQKRA